ncbi:hypothetical protein TELCIR_10413 [Teladorsagia circumcincta]|uniref:ubiquitinyl hydrolase 1 n=1 Tax=Teladorsagia circumcincta TaxID=45464 RepID=A0A2G9UEB9_TELCI|nr:hypothetical protein TELCIR_10413 [Teladorsagia circumcincta]
MNSYRLWLVGDDGNTLLDDGKRTLHQLTVKGKRVNKFLLELRDANGVWPEELRASLTGTQISSLASTTGRPGAVGLVNSGNFCYRNAAIQCLARVSPLTEYLLNEASLNALKKGDANNNESFATTLEYSKLLKEMWAAKKKNISPNSFNEAVRFADQFDDGEQHDCQEFVSFLIERFHTCVARIEHNNSVGDSESSEGTAESEATTSDNEERNCDDAATDEEKAEKATIPENCGIAVDWLPIALYLKYNHSQELACEDDESVAETWSRHFAPSSLEHCLEKFSCPETLDALIHCDTCNEKTKRDKVMTIWRLPRYLNHYGQLSSGHFVAYARGNDEKWLLLNDCSVREVTEEEVDRAGAYLLFFERKD